MSKENPTTVLSHIYNEEYMLPFWLEHHRKIFDHGILVDYDSTDRTIDIIKQYTPDWTILKSRNKQFLAWDTDAEIMELEKNIPIDQYKMCLQTTEFLLINDNKELNDIFKENVYRIQKCRIFDEDENNDPNTLNELLSGIRYGYLADDYRFIHNLNNNYNYTCGRHSFISDCTINNTSDAIVLHFQYYPWNKRSIDRKLNIKNKFPNGYSGPGSHHMRDFQQMHNDKKIESLYAQDLSINEYFQKFLKDKI